MSLNPIQVNGSDLPLQPSALREFREYQQTDQMAVDGATQRNRISTPSNPDGYKYVAELSFQNVTATSFAALDALFVSGSGINYRNPGSKFGVLTFSGLPYPDEASEYGPGESLLSDYKVRVRQY